MTQLENLIQTLCPDGVEYKELCEITKEINIGVNPRKFFKLNPPHAEGFFVTVRELNGLQGVKKYDKTDLISKEAVALINSRAKIEVDDILFSNTGTVGKMALVKESPDNWSVNEGIYVIKPIQAFTISKYLYYYLASSKAYKEYSKMFTGSTLKHITQKALSALSVPVPPLPVQREIVHILDNFTELTAELTARKKQYEYYRDSILPFETTDKYLLGDIASVVRGASPRPIKSFVAEDENGVSWIKIGDAKVDSKYISETKERITEEGAKKSRYVKPGDFILSNSMSFGRPYIY